MSKKDSWPHASVIPRRGLAFFDGIFIRSDSIYNPRPDRALPIFEEEQVFACRLMNPYLGNPESERLHLLGERLLKPGLRVLDVGTGSGIFAIFAAKSECRVVALDNNQRACRLALSNAEFNNIKVRDEGEDVNDLSNGEIVILSRTFDEEFVQQNYGRFDVVILSPPYTPTPTDFKNLVAPHAQSGEIGLDVFREQVTLVPRVLADNGVCFGNQMSAISALRGLQIPTLSELLKHPTDRERIELVKIIRDAFFEGFSLRCIPILEELKSTKEFLKDEFAGIYNQLTENAEKMNEWREEVSGRFPHLSLLCYQVRKSGDGDVRLGDIPWDDLPWEKSSQWTVPKNPVKGWEDRVRIHQAIVNHRLSKGFDPLPVFITSGTTDTLLSFESAEAIPNNGFQENPILQRNPLALIDAEIKSQLLGDLFSVIYLDTTPIYPKELGFFDIDLERRVWIDGKASLNELKDKPKADLAWEILKIWENVTVTLQTADCGIGFHPTFSGYQGPAKGWRWPEIVFTEYRHRTNRNSSRLPNDLNEFQQKATSVVWERFLEAQKTQPEVKDLYKERDSFYSSSSLDDLQASSFQVNYRECEKRAAALAVKLGPEAAQQFSMEQIRKLDLFGCQRVMHEAVHQRFEEYARRLSPKLRLGNVEESILFSLPLGMLFYELKDNRRSAPPFFKGGLWAWFVPNERRRLRHEEAAQHLMHVMWVLLTASYSASSEKAYAGEARNRVTENFAHEVKKVSIALTGKMIQPAKNFFTINHTDKKVAEFGGKLGRVELASDVGKLLNEKELGVTFFEESLTGAGSLINLWCQDPNLIDAQVVVGGQPRDIRALIEACWKVSIDTLPVYALAKRTFVSEADPLSTLTAAKKNERAIKELFSPRINIEGSFPNINWTTKSSPANAPTAWLVRLFLAIFNNIAAHSDPASTPKVRLTGSKTPTFEIEVINMVRRENKEQIVSELVLRGLDRGQAMLGLEWLPTAAGVVGGTQQGKFRSKNVVRSCLKELNGEILEWPDTPPKPGENYTIRIRLDYKAGN